MQSDVFINRAAVITVCLVVIAVVGALLHGLFVPSVDNNEIFKIIGPCFTEIVGALVAIVSYSLGKQSGKSE